MPRRKRESISGALRVFYTILPSDRAALEHFEKELAGDRPVTDIPDADIVRHCVHEAYRKRKK